MSFLESLFNGLRPKFGEGSKPSGGLEELARKIREQNIRALGDTTPNGSPMYPENHVKFQPHLHGPNVDKIRDYLAFLKKHDLWSSDGLTVDQQRLNTEGPSYIQSQMAKAKKIVNDRQQVLIRNALTTAKNASSAGRSHLPALLSAIGTLKPHHEYKPLVTLLETQVDGWQRDIDMDAAEQLKIQKFDASVAKLDRQVKKYIAIGATITLFLLLKDYIAPFWYSLFNDMPVEDAPPPDKTEGGKGKAQPKRRTIDPDIVE